MALADRLVGQKVLVLDIETSPTLTYTFGMRPKWISPDKIVEPSRVMCVGWKWYGGKTKLSAEYDFKARKITTAKHADMINEVWGLWDRADAIVTFNGDRFDLPRLRSEFALADLTPPRPAKSIDLFKLAKKQWQFESMSLNHLSQRFDLGEKFAHSGFDLWRRTMAGEHAAWVEMRTYCVQDVDLTQDVYDRMRGWMPTHPIIGAHNNDLRCNQCQGTNLERTGTVRATVLDHTLYRCLDCGANVKGTWESRVARTRGAS